jgi:hypothetical protein
MEYPKTKRLTGFDGIFMPREDQSRAYEPDYSLSACQSKAQRMFREDMEDEKRYERQRKFFTLDPYEGLRLDIKDDFISYAIGIYRHNFSYRYACQYWPQRAIYEYNNNMPPPGDTFKMYENLPERPAYIIEYGSQIESARMLQICRYLGKSAEYYGPADPCYAVQVRFKAEGGFRYHYVIDVIRRSSGKNPLGTIYTGLYQTWLDKTGQYVMLVNGGGGGNSHLLDDRMDLFDEDFNYLGSNAWNLSKAMVPNAKPLPPSLVRKQEDGDIKFVGGNSVQWFKFPEYTDMVIEQRRAANFKDK